MSTTLSLEQRFMHAFSMPGKFLMFKEAFLKTATESQKQLIQLAEDYIAGLNNMFYDRDVTEFMLKEFDFPMFVKELKHEGLLEGKNKFEYITFTMNIRHIVRHTWELIGSDGKVKTGNDLRKAWPLMWEDNETFTIDQLIKDVNTMK